MAEELDIVTYTGGFIETNAYLVPGKDGHLVIDAPEGTAEFLEEEGFKPSALVLTHGHWDHMWDAAEVKKKFGCPVYYHKDDEAICTNPDRMRSFGLPKKLQPVEADRFLEHGETLEFEPGAPVFNVLHVPGHCPGSLCFFQPEHNILFAGDVLFSSGVGRWDLPGGSNKLLIKGIHEKLLTLPEETVVYPGHGPPTTIGDEKSDNPFL